MGDLTQVKRKSLRGRIITALAILLFIGCASAAAALLFSPEEEDLEAVPSGGETIPPAEKPPHIVQREPFPDADLILTNATVADGLEEKLFTADVAIRDDRIVHVGDAPVNAPGEKVDAAGLILAPGFINSHSHTYEVIFDHPGAGSAVLQGITTEVGGMDGRSQLPLDEHMEAVAQLPPGVNYAMLVGQGSVRGSTIGWENRPASEAEIEQMQDMVREAMRQGAFGLSTGLEYAPGKYASTEEIIALAQAAAEYDGTYVTHMRCEGPQIIPAVQEALNIGREAGIGVGISHLKVVGEANWRHHSEVMDLLEEARLEAEKEDRELWADVYPYLSPDYAVNIPLGEAAVHHSPERITPKAPQWQPPEYRSLDGDEDPVSAENTLAQLAEQENVSPSEMADAILAVDPNTRAQVEMVSEERLREVLAWSGSVIANDASARDPENDPPPNRSRHPRAYGTFARVLTHHVDDGTLSLPETVAKMTSQPARALGIQDRGVIAEGYYADIVLFDPQMLADTATYTNPRAYPEGVVHVLINGEFAVRDGELLPDVRAGRVLRSGSNGD